MHKKFFYLLQFLFLGIIGTAYAMDVSESFLNQKVASFSLMSNKEFEQYKPTSQTEQYCLGVYHILLFENLGKQESLESAEFWFLKAKEQGCERSYCNLIQIYMRTGNYEKAIAIGLEGITAKKYACYLQIMQAYESKSDKEKAIEIAKEGINTIKNNLDYIHIIMELKHELGLLLVRSKSTRDIKTGIELLTELFELGYHKAHVSLAIVYAFGNQCTKVDLRRSQKMLKTFLSLPNVAEKMISHAVALLGYLYEVSNEISEATNVYKSKLESCGKYHLARLTLSGKINGDYEKARKLLEEGFRSSEVLTLFYSLLLMAEGNAESSREIYEINHNKSLFHVVMTLQYAIAYKYGFGFVQSDSYAETLCTLIKAFPDGQEAVMFCKGYIKLLGLDGPVDIKEGLALIDASKNSKPDPYFPRHAFMPVVEKRREQYSAAVLNELLAVPKISKKQKPKKTKNAGTYKQNPFTTVEFWNSNEFPINDSCKVKTIDVENHTIVVESPDEIFEIIVDGFKDDARWVKTLLYHQRIKERQGVGTMIDAKTKHDHTFPEIIDYIIQVGGIEVPFMKNGIIHEQLVMPVRRINKSTNQIVYCRAEYTFGQDISGAKYVYHRLLRPQIDTPAKQQ